MFLAAKIIESIITIVRDFREQVFSLNFICELVAFQSAQHQYIAGIATQRNQLSSALTASNAISVSTTEPFIIRKYFEF